jgi:hypothetical protein
LSAPTTGQAIRNGRNLAAGILLGVATVAFVDEAVFPPDPALAPLLRPVDQRRRARL